MDERTAQALHARNRAIIDTVIAKAEKVCPDAVDLIAVTGSFHSGDFYEKSDLDLLIVIHGDSGYQLAKCFILDDVGHDIYCQTWEQLTHTAEYHDPHVIKLLDVEIVYCANENVRQRYLQLRQKLKDILNRPQDRENLEKVKRHLNDALQTYARMMLTDEGGMCKYLSAEVLRLIEYAVYMLNKAYIRHGVREIPREICTLPILPENFSERYTALIRAENTEELRTATKELLRSVDTLITQIDVTLCRKQHISPNALRGTYEEIQSNWRNKMHYAAREDDAYLSLMTAASCQAFYDDMFAEYDIGRIHLFDGKCSRDTREAALDFDRAMEQYRILYTQTGTEVCRYDGIEDFVADYLK